jgi:hypothetical protein
MKREGEGEWKKVSKSKEESEEEEEVRTESKDQILEAVVTSESGGVKLGESKSTKAVLHDNNDDVLRLSEGGGVERLGATVYEASTVDPDDDGELGGGAGGGRGVDAGIVKIGDKNGREEYEERRRTVSIDR